jgi:hypothetical protein
MRETTLEGLVADLVAVRHAGGYRFKVQERVLRQFAEHCRREGYPDGSITKEDVLCQPPSANSFPGGGVGLPGKREQARDRGRPRAALLDPEKAVSGKPVGCVNAQRLSAGQTCCALQRCVLCGATG